MAGLGIPGGGCAATVGEGQALGFAAACVGDVELGIAGHGRGEDELRAVGGPSGGAVGAAEAGEGDDFAGVHGVHADLGVHDAVVGLVAGESNARGVWGPARHEGDCAESRQGMLVGAVVIH